MMSQVLVRDVDSVILEKLKRRARKNHRSLEAELRLVLEQAATDDQDEENDIQATLERVQAMFAGRRLSDSTELLREDRER
ncbi:MAG: Arc family DNA-binding protein [Capsulimonadales bacterium]|nr:Arc family DNA-binding protein [Capsulimonadales bacterium]